MDATWTEKEAKELADFINYVHVHAEFPGCKKPSEARKLTSMFTAMALHQRKVESYVFEVKKVIDKDGKNLVTKVD